MSIHTGDKPYNCEICNESFTQSGNLKIHTRAHTGAKPYICKVCDNGFTISSDLKRHMFIHTGEKPYKCELCDKSFIRFVHLKAHTRAHTQERSHISVKYVISDSHTHLPSKPISYYTLVRSLIAAKFEPNRSAHHITCMPTLKRTQ